MSFQDNVFFAAIMALMEELEEEKQNSSDDTYSLDDYEYSTPDFTPNAARFIEQLCDIAQGLFDGADAACNTVSDTSPKELIPPMICGIIFETLNVLAITNEEKKEMYRTASQFCGVGDVFPEEFLFSEVHTELSESLAMLTNMGFEMILTASQKSDNSDAGVGFIKVFAEFMLYLEKNLSENYPYVSLKKRPSLLAVEKTLSIAKKQLRQMEEENPELKSSQQQKNTDNDKHRIDSLLNNARSERKKGNMKQAEAYYEKVKEIQPDNWEAYFFSVFCSVHRTSSNTNPSAIQNYTEEISNCISNAMRLAKKQLYSRGEIIDGIGDVAVGVTEIASNYFVASMNRYKAAGSSTLANNAKIAQVNAIIQMLFAVGDSIEANFNDDAELCAYTACNCWKIAFDCYENCNMPAPQGLSDHYYKFRKYIPDFRCAKPLSDRASQSSHGSSQSPRSTSQPIRSTSQTSSSSGGCYIATAVYGSYDCPPVWTLRRFRDYFLANRWYGRLFIRIYYAISPRLVKAFKDTTWFTKMCKQPLDKLVAYLIQNGYDSTAYSDSISCITSEKELEVLE